MNTECYRFEKIQYSDGFFSSSIDATYIIHLEGNGRLPEIQKQLEEYHPTNTVYIVYNKGYKKCKKQDYITNTARDLVDANLQIFKHAELHGYGNILVLEDDFIFSDKIKDKKHQENVLRFLNKNKDRPFMYFLGCVPRCLIPYDYYNYKGLFLAMHSVIFSRAQRNNILKDDQSLIKDWDGYNFFSNCNNKYVYYLPLCYQLFPETENSKLWGEEYGFIIKYFFVLNNMLPNFGVDKRPEPYFSIVYIYAKFLFFILIIFFLYIIWFATKLLFGKSKIKGKNIKPKK
jgi:hypothetical protein